LPAPHVLPDQNLRRLRRRVRAETRQARFANRCPDCSEEDAADPRAKRTDGASPEMNAERRKAIRDLLYRKDS